MKKVSVDVSGHSNVEDERILAAVQSAFEALKAACVAANMGPLKAELSIMPMGE